MKPIPSYPVWLSAFMLLGPSFMVSGIGFNSQRLIWWCQIAGAGMVTLALFSLSKRLHEQMEEMASLRQLLKDQGPRPSRCHFPKAEGSSEDRRHAVDLLAEGKTPGN